MALVADTAIVTAAEVEAISGEAVLSRLDEGSATIANALVQATNYIMLDLRGLRAIDPAKISNTSELKIPAALKAAYLRLVAQPDDESQKRAASLAARYREAFDRYVFVSTDVSDGEQTLADKGLPRGLNHDSAPFFGSTDNRRPGSSQVSGYRTR